MDKKSRPRWASQAKAFELFNKGYAVFYVAETLRITIAESRSYYKLFQMGEEISPEQKQDINNFIEGEWKKEREDSLKILCGDLSLLRKKMEYVKRVDECVKKTLEFATEADEVLIFLGAPSQMFHWMKVSGESRLIDIIKNMCFN